jgi:hypothetical protein
MAGSLVPRTNTHASASGLRDIRPFLVAAFTVLFQGGFVSQDFALSSTLLAITSIRRDDERPSLNVAAVFLLFLFSFGKRLSQDQSLKLLPIKKIGGGPFLISPHRYLFHRNFIMAMYCTALHYVALGYLVVEAPAECHTTNRWSSSRGVGPNGREMPLLVDGREMQRSPLKSREKLKDRNVIFPVTLL